MLGFLAFSYVHVMFFCEPVVPTAVPRGEPIGVALPCVGKLRASQRLNIEEAFGISVGAEINLSVGARICGPNREFPSPPE